MNEANYPTRRFMRCKRCGRMFPASLSGRSDCPECRSEQTEPVDSGGESETDGESSVNS